MRSSIILLLIMSVSHAFAETNACPTAKVLEDAKTMSAAAVAGQPVVVPPCLAAKPKPKAVVNKPQPVVAKVVEPPKQVQTLQSEPDSHQMMNTVVSPIVIVTGGSCPAQTPVETVTKVVKQSVPKEVIVYRQSPPIIKIVKQPRKKNIVSVMGGVGLTGAHANVDNQNVNVTTDHGPVAGIQFQRRIDDQYLLGLTVLTNTTTLVSAGWEF